MSDAIVNAAHTSGRQASMLGVIGTLGTADVKGSALTLPIGVNPDNGAMYVDVMDTTFNVGTLSVGTINSVATANVLFMDENGSAYGIKQVNNKPRVSAMPYLYDIAEGNVSGHTPYAKLGYNGDVGATEEDIITQGGVYPWLAAGTALEVVSAGTADTLTGPGIQKVRVGYLGTSYSSESEEISLAGTTGVALTNTKVLRVNSIRATQTGATGVAAGNIIVRNVGGTTVYRQITLGFTRGRGLTYTVPLGKTLYITSISVSSGYTTSGKVVRWIGRAQVDDTAPTVRIPFFQPFFEIITQDASFHREFEIPIAIPATADLKVSATSDGATSFCSCALRGWLE